jgi:DNA-binding response OmpR family regulator
MLPGIDGLDIARLLRAESDVPIIMLSARSTEGDVLTGLEVGADDYMTKPFSPRELVARVRTVLRRVGPVAQHAEAAPPNELRFGPLRISTEGHQVFVGDDLISLTPREFRLLATLARAPGRVYTRAELLDRVAGLDSDSLERAVDFHIMNLRRKIDKHVYPSIPDGGEPATCIETVFGIGYRFSDRFADPSA